MKTHHKRIPLTQLQVGMFVLKLDVSWFWTPFFSHRFLIRDPQQLDRLRDIGVQTVVIDVHRGDDVPSAPPPPAREPLATFDERVPVRPPVLQLTPLSQRTQEYAQAAAARDQLEQSVGQIFTTFQGQGSLQAAQVDDTVRELTIIVRTLSTGALFMAVSQRRDDDVFLRQHALSTCTLALLLGHALAYNPQDLQTLATAALLHDLSLLQLPPALWRPQHEPTSSLTRSERERLHAHPAHSARLLKRHPHFTPAVRYIIEHHHVRLTDRGSSTSLPGALLPPLGRLLALVDRYDELLTGLSGGPTMSPYQALQRVYQEAQAGDLDPILTARLVQLVGVYPLHSQVRLTTHERGVVTDLHPHALHTPVVTVTHDPQGRPYETPYPIDLAHPSNSHQPRAIEAILSTHN